MANPSRSLLPSHLGLAFQLEPLVQILTLCSCSAQGSEMHLRVVELLFSALCTARGCGEHPCLMLQPLLLLTDLTAASLPQCATMWLGCSHHWTSMLP